MVKEFEIGKSYEHSSGKRFTIIGKVKTFYFGECYVAEEEGKTDLTPVGIGEGYADNHKEIPDWRKDYE